MTGVASLADALWRAMTYLSVAQLHLRANPLIYRPLRASDVKSQPSGHWGTVPGTAWVLAHVALAAGLRLDVEIIPVIGAGHAGVAQRAMAWLTGDLAKIDPCFGRDLAGLTELVRSFPESGSLGSEVHPLLPGGAYQGGWLGGAFAFAQGVALGAPDRVVVAILGDGECETPTTAASWLACGTVPDARVLPVVHLNGYRMGGPSLLGVMGDEPLAAYFRGLGWEPLIAEVGTGDTDDHVAFHCALADAINAVRRGRCHVVVMRCVKGWSGPLHAHKTPLTGVASDPIERASLRDWLSSYRPGDLFDGRAQPVGALASALARMRHADIASVAGAVPPPAVPQGRGFAAEVSTVLRAHAAAGDFKVFSPDELRSNRLGGLADEPWAHEVLAEEVLFGWLAGWTAAGRRGLLISYEAFAPLLLTALVGQLKQRRLASADVPSINLLLTSYGWHNVYTHGDPSLATALLAVGDPAVRVFTPADSDRTAVTLDDALRSSGRVNVIIAGKHPTPSHPRETVAEERRHGLAIWNHLSDPDEPDLTLVCAGDLAVIAVTGAAEQIRERHACRIRVVNVHDLTALASLELQRHVGEHAAVLVVTLGHPAAVWGLLAGRLRNAAVLGWREPPHPMAQDELAAYAGVDVAGVVAAAAALLARRER